MDTSVIPPIDNEVYLCLSGGGALGFAHIGVLQALEEHDIYPTQIAGTSMGAIIGLFYAAGFKPKYMLNLIKEDKLYKISTLLTFKASFFRPGLSDHTTLRKLIRELIPHNSFEGLEKKLYVCVSNMTDAWWEIKSTGKMLDKWVAASASIPGVFEPIEYRNKYYCDGSVMNNMPAQCFGENNERTIGVDVIPYTSLNTPKTIRTLDVAFASIRLMQHQNSKKGRKACKYLIEPLVLNEYHEFSFDEYQQIYQIGYDTAIEYIKKHPEILDLSNQH